MAYATRLKCPFFSKDGKAYQIWFEFLNWGGGVTTITGRESPGIIEWSRRGVDVFTPIRASHVEIGLWRKSLTELDVLLDAATNEWRIRIVSGTSQAAIDASTYDEYWLGYLVLDNYEDSTIKIPDELDLEANDGLGQLKNVPYTDASGSPEVAYTGRESYRDIARRCLDKLGFSLPFRMASRMYPDGVAATVDPWDKMEADNAIFYDDDGKALDCYQVLQQLLYRMSSELFQRDGSWHFIAIELQDGSDYTVYKYTDVGAADGTDTQGVALDVDALVIAETIKRDSGQRGFIQPYGRVSLRFNHGLIPSLIHGGSFEVTFTRGDQGTVEVGEEWADFWTLSSGGPPDPEVRFAGLTKYVRDRSGPRGYMGAHGQRNYFVGNYNLFIPAFFHGSTRDLDAVKALIIAEGLYAEQEGDTLTSGQKIAFTGRIRIPYNEGEGRGKFQAYWRIWITGSEYIMLSDGSWYDATGDTEAERTQTIKPEGDQWGDNGLELDLEFNFEFISDAVPVTGALNLKLWGTSDVDGSDLDPEGVEWDDIFVTIIDEDGDQLETTYTEARTDLPDKARKTIELLTGPGPLSFMESAVTWAGTFYTDFVTDLIVAATELDELTTETWIRFLNRFLERRLETYSRLDAEMGTALTINSRNFALTYLRKDIRHQRDELEMVRHIFDGAATIVFASLTENVGTYSLSSSAGTPIGSGGQASTLDGLAGYISTKNPIAFIDAEYENGENVSVLTVDAVTIGRLYEDDLIVVVDRVTGRPFIFQMSADEADITWDVEDPDNPGNPLTLVGPISNGSGVYYSNPQALEKIRSPLKQLISKDPTVLDDDVLGQIDFVSSDESANAAGVVGRITLRASGDFDDNDAGTYLTIWINSQAAAETFIQALQLTPTGASFPGNLTIGDLLLTAAATAARAGFNLPIGTAPSSPNAGDFWHAAARLLWNDGTDTWTIGHDPGHGHFYITTPAATTIAVAGTYVKAAGATATLHLDDWDDDGGTDNRLRYIGVGTVHLCVSVSLSFTIDGNLKVIAFRIAKNGDATTTEAIASTVNRKAAQGSDVGAVAVFAGFEVVNGDYIEIWLTNETDTNDVTIEHAQLMVLSV